MKNTTRIILIEHQLVVLMANEFGVFLRFSCVGVFVKLMWSPFCLPLKLEGLFSVINQILLPNVSLPMTKPPLTPITSSVEIFHLLQWSFQSVSYTCICTIVTNTFSWSGLAIFIPGTIKPFRVDHWVDGYQKLFWSWRSGWRSQKKFWGHQNLPASIVRPLWSNCHQIRIEGTLGHLDTNSICFPAVGSKTGARAPR